jgi:Flp pilus assembly protein TadD
MRLRRARRIRAIFLAAVATAGCSFVMFWASGLVAQVATGKAITAADNELEPAITKAREGKLDEALAMIKDRAAKHSEWPPAQVMLARMLFAINQPPAARRVLEQAAAATPNEPEVYLTLGTLALSEGRISDARLNFDHVASLIAAGHWTADKSKMLRTECLAGLATVGESREDWKATAEQLSAWLELDPKNGQVRQRLGRALFMTGKTEEAYKALKEAVSDMPALEPAAVSMGLLYTRAGDLKKAEEWLDRALALEPKNGRIHASRAFWFLERGRTALARAEIDETMKLDPPSIETKRLQALIGWHARDLAGAQSILESLHRDLPADGMVANLLALVLLEQDDSAKRARGSQLAEVNAAQFPRSPEVMATLGWSHYLAGRLDQAEEKLAAAAAANGGRTSADIAYFSARVVADKGRKAEARKVLERMTNLPGAFAHRDDAIAFLKTLPDATK